MTDTYHNPNDNPSDDIAEAAEFVSDEGADAAAEAAADLGEHADAFVADAQHDTLSGPEPKRTATDDAAQNLRKAAEDTAYAAVGFVGLMADKAKEFYEDQRRQYAEAHPDADAEQGAKNFLAQLREQFDRFITDVNKGFHDLADRGRASGRDADAEAGPVDSEAAPADDAWVADRTEDPGEA